MSIETKHPDFLEVAEDYRVMRDSFAGQRRIKEATFLYLPPTTGQIKDGAMRSLTSPGWVSYSGYLDRAIFPEFVRDAVNTLVGVLHSEDPIIELPPELEPMRRSATRKGETLEMLLRRINEQQLLFGRFGLLPDFPQDPLQAERASVPHLVTYEAETIINWDDERFTEFSTNRLSFVVLNETVFVRGPLGANVFDWMEERRFRVLLLDPVDPDEPPSAANPLIYKTFVENDDVRSDTVVPMFGGRVLEDIPFVIIGANDLNFTPDEIPMLGIANLALAVYRGEADYRQSLHMQGQDTLVIIGDEITRGGAELDEDEPTEIGAGAVIRITAGEGAKAEFVGVNSDGIPEQRAALEADRQRALSMGARLLEPRGSQAESAEALRIRVAASTATLSTIARTGAAGLEAALRHCAVWVGADPDAVKVRPNMDFTQESPSPELARELGEAIKTGRIPLSSKAVHKWLQAKNFTKFTYDEELKLIATEEARDASFGQAEKFVGRTDRQDDHEHSYMLWVFPDGSVHGITDVTNGHFHAISEEGRTDPADKHFHALLQRQPLEKAAAPAEESDPTNPLSEEDEGSSDQE